MNNREREELVTKNLGLVGYTLKQMNIEGQDYNDMFNIGIIGLIKAEKKFDETKNNTFATYAIACIKNEILKAIEKNKKHKNNISLNSKVRNTDSRGFSEGITVEDVIEDEKQNYAMAIEKAEILEKALNYIVNKLEPREKYIILALASGAKQEDIASHLNLSQSYASRINQRAIKKIKKSLEDKPDKENKYKISVPNGTIIKMQFKVSNEIMSRILSAIDFEQVPKFNIKYKNGELTIKVPADTDSMMFIAKILQVVE